MEGRGAPSVERTGLHVARSKLRGSPAYARAPADALRAREARCRASAQLARARRPNRQYAYYEDYANGSDPAVPAQMDPSAHP